MMMLQSLLPAEQLPMDAGQCRIQGLQLDSRKVRQGDLFIAVPGLRSDGRHYLDQALAAGAAAVVCEAEEFSVGWRGPVPVIAIPSLSVRVGELADRWYGHPSRQMQVMGVTGTNGKTSIAWFLRDAFDAIGRHCGLVGTLGVGLKGREQDTGHTTPDALTLQAALAAMKNAGADTVAMEVSSHALDQNRIGTTRVKVAIFSNLSRDHLDYHGDMESYLAAKSALFTREGVQLAVINSDDPAACSLVGCLADGVRCVTFGDQEGASVRCQSLQCLSTGLEAQLSVAGTQLSVKLPLFGRFNVSNVMAVAGTLHGLDMEPEVMARALNALTPVPGRMEPVCEAGTPTVIVDYAHTPDALEKALQATRDHLAGRLHCVVGCGGDRDAGKRPQMAAVAERLADHVVLTSDNPRSEDPDAILDAMVDGVSKPDSIDRETDRGVAIADTIAAAAADDVIVIAGKGHETYQEIAGVRHDFDDREHARQALKRWGGRS